MLDKLKAIEQHYQEVEARLAEPSTYNDPALAAKLNKEQRDLEPLMETYRAYRKAFQDMEEAQALFSDSDLGEMAREEYAEAKAAVPALEEKLKFLLLPKDPNDDKNVIVEIRACPLCPFSFPHVLHVRRVLPLERGSGFCQLYRARRDKGDMLYGKRRGSLQPSEV